MRLRVAGGPAVGPEVPEVEEFAGADGAHGIARIAGTDVGVPLAFEENGVAGAGFLRAGQQAQEAAACHFRQGLQPGHFETGRGEVHEVDEIIADLAGLHFAGQRTARGCRVPPS